MFPFHRWRSKWRNDEDSTVGIDTHTGVDRFSRFAAMPKLVDEQELAELGLQAGFNQQLLRKLRTERRRAYRLYLSELLNAYRQISRQALEHAANEPTAAPHFAQEVFNSRVRFEAAVFLLRLSTWLPVSPVSITQQWTIDLLGKIGSERILTETR